MFRPSKYLNLFFIISALVHAGILVLLLFSGRKEDLGYITVHIEYRQAGDGSPPATATANKTVRLVTRRSASQQLASDDASIDRTQKDYSVLGSGESLTVLGADLGIHASYPRLSRLLGEKGMVLIEIKKDLAGSPGSLSLIGSSGFTRLDQSALLATQEALNRGQLSSYLEKRGQMQISFIFKLTSSSTSE